MTVRAVRLLTTNADIWAELEVVSPDGSALTIWGKEITAVSEQRVVTALADDNAGHIGHYFTDLRIGASVTDYPSFDDEVIATDVPVDPTAGGGGTGGTGGGLTPKAIAYRDDVRVIAGLARHGDGVVAFASDLTTLLSLPVDKPSRLVWVAELPKASPVSPYSAYGPPGAFADEWDVRKLAALTTGTPLQGSVTLPNSGLSPSGDLGNPGATGPTLTKDGFGTGKHALTFASASSQYAEIVPDPTGQHGQPFVVFLVARVVTATSAAGYFYSTGLINGSGTPAGERNAFLQSTTNGLVMYGGGTAQAVKGPSADPTMANHHLFTVVHDGQNSFIRVDGTQISAAPVTTVGLESRRQFRLAQNINGGGGSADVMVGHVIVYNATTTDLGTALTTIEDALVADWGITRATVPAAPVLNTPTAPAPGSIALTWPAVVRTSSYKVYRSTTSTVTTASTLAGTVTTNSFTDTGLTSGATYYYAVAGGNYMGQGSLSAVVSGTTSTAPTTLTDNFTGTAGASLTGRSGVVSAAAFVISPSGTTAQKSTTSGTAVAVYGPLTTSNNKAVVTIPARGVANNAGPVCRCNAAGDTFYTVRVNSAGSAIDLQKSVAGTVTSLATGLATYTAGDTLEVRAVGSTITCYRNGTLLTTVTDTSITTGTYGGFRVSGAATQATFDDLTVADV